MTGDTPVTTLPAAQVAVGEVVILDGVRYKPWPREPRYLGGEDGSVVGPRGHPLRQQLNKRTGRLTITIRTGDRTRPVPVHTVICEAWHGPRPPGRDCAHGDGVPTHNWPGNLRWATPVENAADRVLHGTDLQGERNGRARLTADAVREIRRAVAAGATARELARQYGLSEGTVRAAATGVTWQHVDGPAPVAGGVGLCRGEGRATARLTADAVRQIRAAYATGASPTALAARFGVSVGAVHAVRTGRTWRHVVDAEEQSA